MEFSRSIVWVRAMEMAQAVVLASQKLPRHQRFGMRDQIMRSAISVPSNIAEGWARESRKEKSHFLAIAHGSLAELLTLLELCTRLGWLPAEPLAPAMKLGAEVSRMLTDLRRKWRAAPSPDASPAPPKN